VFSGVTDFHHHLSDLVLSHYYCEIDHIKKK
jgi:hypothetical protein